MKRDLMENWKKNLYALLGLTFAFLITYLAMMGSYEDASISALKAYVDSHVESFAIISFFALVFYASLIMNNMQTKEARLSYLMLPASPLEKFIARALYVTVGIVLMIFVASLLAEAAHWLFMPFFKDLPEELKVCVWPEAWGKIFDAINPFQTQNVYLNIVEGTDPSTWQQVEKSLFFIYLMGYAASLWQHSIFVLGGNYFGKHPFLKTIGTMILVAILIAWICTYMHWDNLGRMIGNLIDDHTHWLTEEMVAGFISFIFFAFTVLNWWLSYKLFTRRQVIEPKFRLL
ncbi:MAG: hypothetical protein IJZ42_00320 [Lachnospiraceae bacterium]|nr:hypothetical protein [Lachnospiraceae bacterium]